MKIKGLMDLNGAYLSDKGFVVIKSNDGISMEIFNTSSLVFTPQQTIITLNLGIPAIKALLAELGINVEFECEAYNKDLTSEPIKENMPEESKQGLDSFLDKLYCELNSCKNSWDAEKILSLIERTKKLV